MKVKFVPQNIELEIRPNQSVMHLAHENNIYIKSVCKGLPSCAECRVRVVDGDHNVLPPLQPELALIGSAHFVDGRRLSCQLKCFGDVVVDLTEQVEKEKNLNAGKKLKGGRPSDSMESFAVRGNLIDEEPEAVPAQTTEEPREQRPQNNNQQQRQHNNNQQRHNRHHGRGGGNRDRNFRPRQGGGGQGGGQNQGQRPNNDNRRK